MFLGLLPGLRDARIPLATGYCWLLGLWVLSGSELPIPSETDSGIMHQIFELYAFLGKAGFLAVVTFAVYVLGSFVLVTPGGQISRFLAPGVRRVSPRMQEALRSHIEVTVQRAVNDRDLIKGADLREMK
jgi:hypothetical protein